MDKSIKEVFEDICSTLEIGPKLAKAIASYRLGFVNKNQDHAEFFGSNLLGVHQVRFTNTDRAAWFEDVVKADEFALDERIIALPNVNEDFIVSSDTMNISCAWLLHAVFNTKKLNDKEKHAVMVDVAMVLQYKFFTSRLFRLFKYPADREVAEATYAALSGKFAIKQAGSGDAMFRARAEEVVGDSGLHKHAIRVMNDDLEVVYLLNDMQGRIRDMLKKIYDLHLRTHRTGVKIKSLGATVEHDGEEVLRDRTKGVQNYRLYIESVIGDRNSFIKEELTEIIERTMKTMPPKLFKQSLEWMSDNYNQRTGTVVGEIVAETIVHMFDYFSQNKGLIKNASDSPGLLSRLRGVYMSSRSTDPALLVLRDKTEEMVKKATANRNTTILASVRTGVLLYIVLRTICKHYYAKT